MADLWCLFGGPLCLTSQVWAAWTQGLLSALGIFLAAWLPARARRDAEKKATRAALSFAARMHASVLRFEMAYAKESPEAMSEEKRIMAALSAMAADVPMEQLPPEAIDVWLTTRSVAAEVAARCEAFDLQNNPYPSNKSVVSDLTMRVAKHAIALSAALRAVLPRLHEIP